jgi:cytochrome c-type biogenesis protein CcmE
MIQGRKMIMIGSNNYLGLTTHPRVKEAAKAAAESAKVAAGEAPQNTPFRLGGMVVAGSVQRPGEDLSIRFDLTDTAHTVTVAYTGILPDLFSEGQGIVTQGSLGKDGTFVASQVLAKHDENYMPPEVDEALQKAQAMGVQ